jgi:hypothetical protein
MFICLYPEELNKNKMNNRIQQLTSRFIVYLSKDEINMCDQLREKT